MPKSRAPYKHLELSGMIQHNKAHYENFNPTEGVPLEGIPLCPRGVSKKGRGFWNTTIPALCQMGVLSYTDMGQMENLLYAYEALHKAMDELQSWDAQEHEVDIESVTIRTRLLNNYLKLQANFNVLARSFGLTPSDRTRLPIIGEQEKVDTDPLDALGL